MENVCWMLGIHDVRIDAAKANAVSEYFRQALLDAVLRAHVRLHLRTERDRLRGRCEAAEREADPAMRELWESVIDQKATVLEHVKALWEDYDGSRVELVASEQHFVDPVTATEVSIEKVPHSPEHAGEVDAIENDLQDPSRTGEGLRSGQAEQQDVPTLTATEKEWHLNQAFFATMEAERAWQSQPQREEETEEYNAVAKIVGNYQAKVQEALLRMGQNTTHP
jgi:hypothetical protein